MELASAVQAVKASGVGAVAASLRMPDGSKLAAAALHHEYGSHLFFSHKQDKGQGQVASARSDVLLLTKGVTLFVDVEAYEFEGLGDLEQLTEQTQNFLLLLTDGIFDSQYVVANELLVALMHNIPIIVMRETDTQHGTGGLMMQEFREQFFASQHVQAVVAKPEVMQAGWDAAKMADFLLNEKSDHDVLHLEWHRERAMKNATLKAIVERIHAMPVDSLVSRDGMVYGGTASVQNDDIPVPKNDHHLFLSEAHPNSQTIASLLRERFPSLRILVSSDPTPSCDWALILLSDGAFNDPAYEPSVVHAVKHLGMDRIMLFYKGPPCTSSAPSTSRASLQRASTCSARWRPSGWTIHGTVRSACIRWLGTSCSRAPRSSGVLTWVLT